MQMHQSVRSAVTSKGAVAHFVWHYLNVEGCIKSEWAREPTLGQGSQKLARCTAIHVRSAPRQRRKMCWRCELRMHGPNSVSFTGLGFSVAAPLPVSVGRDRGSPALDCWTPTTGQVKTPCLGTTCLASEASHRETWHMKFWGSSICRSSASPASMSFVACWVKAALAVCIKPPCRLDPWPGSGWLFPKLPLLAPSLRRLRRGSPAPSSWWRT